MGMIVVGVVKGYVDNILILGMGGGMGVFLLMSIKYVGMLWEFGIVEIY